MLHFHIQSFSKCKMEGFYQKKKKKVQNGRREKIYLVLLVAIQYTWVWW